MPHLNCHHLTLSQVKATMINEGCDNVSLCSILQLLIVLKGNQLHLFCNETL